jgi:putative phosphoesterase
MVGASGGTLLVGVISDTHGLLRPEALKALEGCQHVLHAGDVGAKTILETLALVAPVTAVRGNADTETWARELPATTEVELLGNRILLTHDAANLWATPPDVHVVVSGHTHVPRCWTRRGVLDFNPGSAGPRRFRHPVSLGRLHITEEGIRGELLALDV